jgi:diguanylate cyclase (GGDEF)-like protein
MVSDDIKSYLARERDGWDTIIVAGPSGIGKTYLVQEAAQSLGYKVIKINLASRENPVKSIISALEMHFGDKFSEESGILSVTGVKGLLVGNMPLAEDVLLGSLAYFIELLLEDEEKTLLLIDDIPKIYTGFTVKLLTRLRTISTGKGRKIVAVMRQKPDVPFPEDSVVLLEEVDKQLFIERFGETDGFLLWELTGANLGLSSFISETTSYFSVRRTLEGIFFDIYEQLDEKDRDVLKYLAVWGLGYDGFFTLEFYDSLDVDMQNAVARLAKKHIVEIFAYGGFRFRALQFMHYILKQVSEDEKYRIAENIKKVIVMERKVFLARRGYFSLYQIGCLRMSRYLLVKTLRFIRTSGGGGNTDILIGIKEHFLKRTDVPVEELLFVASYVWWLDMYDNLLLDVFAKHKKYLLKRAYLSRFYGFLERLFLGTRDVFPPVGSNYGPVISFIDKLENAWETRQWDSSIDEEIESLGESIHSIWLFVYYYVKAQVSSMSRKMDYVYKAYEIATDMENPVFIVEVVKLILSISPLSRFEERIEILSKAYRISPPTSHLFEKLVPDMVENFREVSEKSIIDEFIDYVHVQFRSLPYKESLFSKAVFHYMVSGNLAQALIFISLLEEISTSPVVPTYLRALHAVLVGDKTKYRNYIEELSTMTDMSDEYITHLMDMASVWLDNEHPHLPYISLDKESHIALWYLSFWTYAAYYINGNELDEGLKFINSVIENLSSAGMEFTKHVAYVYKGHILYKKGEILRSREFFKAAYMFFKKSGYEERASNLTAILSYVRPDQGGRDLSPKDIYLSWSYYYRRVDAIASLYESLIDMLLYIAESDSVDLFLDRLISEMLYILVAEKIFIFAYKDGEIRYFKSYGLGSSGTSFTKTVKQILKEGSMISHNPSTLQALYQGTDYTIGLFAESPSAGVFDSIHLDMAEKILRIVESVLVGNEVRRLAIYDSLTGLFTRWYFFIRFSEEFERSKRENRPLAVLYMDIDDFKKINDRYGHLEGDEVLRRVGKVIRQNVRTVDMPARYGGEEMVIMLSGSNIEDAAMVAERLRKMIKLEFSEKPYKVTVSIGVAGIPEMKVSSPDKLIEMADIAMYYAKRTGKDKVVIYSPEMEDN